MHFHTFGTLYDIASHIGSTLANVGANVAMPLNSTTYTREFSDVATLALVSATLDPMFE